MSTIFMNLENSNPADAHRLSLKMDMQRADKRVALSYLTIYYT